MENQSKIKKPLEGCTLTFNHEEKFTKDAILIDGINLGEAVDNPKYEKDIEILMIASERFLKNDENHYEIIKLLKRRLEFDSNSKFIEALWKEKKEAGFAIFILFIIQSTLESMKIY